MKVAGRNSVSGGKLHGRRQWTRRSTRLGPTGHGFPNREHLGEEGVKGDSPRPKEWLEDMVGGVVAMAGGRELAAHAK